MDTDYNINDKQLVQEFLKLHLTPNKEKKKKNGEVFTPEHLIEEMLDKLPKEVWSNPDLKWFDPAVGHGNFMIFVYYRLMEGLKNSSLFKDELERKTHIIKNMLYMSELNPDNIKECKRIFNNEINIYEGDTLKMNRLDVFGVEKFDIVVGNPPYQAFSNSKKASGTPLWNKFVISELNVLKQDGYLVFVHPSAWRKPGSEMFKLTTKENTMIYLEIHNSKDGLKMFQAGTRYDWYVIKNTKNIDYKTIIKDELGNIDKLNLNNYEFLPNFNINLILPLLGNGCKILFNSSYHRTRDYVSSEKTKEFKYPLIHSTNKSGIRYMYSSINDKGHFGISKVIFGESGINDVIIDLKGEYGMTQGAMAIEIINENEGKKLKKALLSGKFQIILKASSWGNFRIDWRLFTYFKKDFYKELI
jgi:hypothetical protein